MKVDVLLVAGKKLVPDEEHLSPFEAHKTWHQSNKSFPCDDRRGFSNSLELLYAEEGVQALSVCIGQTGGHRHSRVIVDINQTHFVVSSQSSLLKYFVITLLNFWNVFNSHLCMEDTKKMWQSPTNRIMHNETPEFSLQRNTERFSTNDLNSLLQKLLTVIKE